MGFVLGRVNASYQFRKTSLSLAQNLLHPLIHGLLLLFKDLRVLALLQALEDLKYQAMISKKVWHREKEKFNV